MMMLSEKIGFLIFLTGKILRFSFFVGFLFFLLKGAKNLAGYDLNQTLFFFLTFNLVDVLGQFLYREVYRFRPQIVSGSFDLTLTKPTSALFRSLMGGADIIDFVTIPFLVYAVYYVGGRFDPTNWEIFLYILLVINGLLIATAFHIAVLAFGILTLEVDHLVMIYRDMVSLGRFPVSIYKNPLRGFLTYLVPVATMVTLPAEALMGIVSPRGVYSSFLIAGLVFFLALKLWTHSLRYYTSASS
jgi:ABC-2 type transport system permease protein